MARDCPDRQRGADWRNDGPAPASAGQIGGGDAVDREYEVCYYKSISIILLIKT